MIIKKGKKKKEKEKAGVTIFVSDKIDFKIKIAKKSLYNNKGINTSRRYNDCIYLCSQHQNT